MNVYNLFYVEKIYNCWMIMVFINGIKCKSIGEREI